MEGGGVVASDTGALFPNNNDLIVPLASVDIRLSNSTKISEYTIVWLH